MRRAGQTLLILALAFFAFAIARWIFLSRNIADEKGEQRRAGRVTFDLSRQEGWKSADYFPRRTGLYSLVLETQGPKWKPHPTATFAGAFEIEIIDPMGNVIKRDHVTGQFLYHSNENHIHWSGLDALPIGSTGSGPWKLRVLISQPDANFSEMVSALILQPPPHFDVGWAGLYGMIEIVLIAAFGLLLLCVSAALFYFSRRSNRRGSLSS
jgi:hypothetical protein